ncbi:MAG: efflux RND transporter periplasmic adaptor subunit [Verrucomicrobiota bacterium]|nr:efflux RND transporter periplasmic adaptor subunit [Verrucomicrobiota bacterium]
MKKLIIILAVLAALGYGGAHFWKKYQAQQHAAKVPKRPTNATIESRNIQFAIAAAGDIGPADQVSVRPEVNGKIALLPVDIGDKVKKGDLLFTLDDTDLQTERSSRMTEIEGAKLQVEKAKRNFERAQRLFTDKLISQEVFDDSKTEFELAKNALERADKALRQVDDHLSKTKIVAPFDCTILTRPVSVGQAVSGSGGFNSGTEVMSIANLNEMIITAHINQVDVVRVNSGQQVEIQVDSVPGLKMKGSVDRIAPQATLKNGIKGFAAQITIKKIDPRVRPGMTANLSIPIASAKDVLAIPLAAIFTEQGERYAYVKKQNSFDRRPIQIGVTDDSFGEVTDGLLAGDIVSLEQPNARSEGKAAKNSSDKRGEPGARRGSSGGSRGTNRPSASRMVL